jgi:hypothetical protein
MVDSLREASINAVPLQSYGEQKDGHDHRTTVNFHFFFH